MVMGSSKEMLLQEEPKINFWGYSSSLQKHFHGKGNLGGDAPSRGTENQLLQIQVFLFMDHYVTTFSMKSPRRNKKNKDDFMELIWNSMMTATASVSLIVYLLHASELYVF